MTAHAKFLFDTEFGEGAESDEPPAPTFSAEELEAVRASAFAQGQEVGRNEAMREFNASAAVSIDKLVQDAGRLAANMQEQHDRVAAEAIEIAVASAHMLAHTLIAREPHETVLALFEECIGHVSVAPHIVVRVGAGEIEHLRDELKARAELHGCNGRIVVLTEEDLQPGDCRIEWADGGLTRDSATLRHALNALVETRFPAGWKSVLPELTDETESADSDLAANTATEEHVDE